MGDSSPRKISKTTSRSRSDLIPTGTQLDEEYKLLQRALKPKLDKLEFEIRKCQQSVLDLGRKVYTREAADAKNDKMQKYTQDTLKTQREQSEKHDGQFEKLGDLFHIMDKQPSYTLLQCLEFELIPVLETHFQPKFVNMLGAALEKYISGKDFREY